MGFYGAVKRFAMSVPMPVGAPPRPTSCTCAPTSRGPLPPSASSSRLCSVARPTARGGVRINYDCVTTSMGFQTVDLRPARELHSVGGGNVSFSAKVFYLFNW